MKRFSLVILIAFSTFLLDYCERNLRSLKIEDISKKLSSGSGLGILYGSANKSSKSEFNRLEKILANSSTIVSKTGGSPSHGVAENSRIDDLFALLNKRQSFIDNQNIGSLEGMQITPSLLIDDRSNLLPTILPTTINTTTLQLIQQSQIRKYCTLLLFLGLLL